MEADAVLSGNQDVIRITDSDVSEAETVLAEADRLLTGSYE